MTAVRVVRRWGLGTLCNVVRLRAPSAVAAATQDSCRAPLRQCAAARPLSCLATDTHVEDGPRPFGTRDGTRRARGQDQCAVDGSRLKSTHAAGAARTACTEVHERRAMARNTPSEFGLWKTTPKEPFFIFLWHQDSVSHPPAPAPPAVRLFSHTLYGTDFPVWRML